MFYLYIIIKLIEHKIIDWKIMQFETVKVKTRKVSCDGTKADGNKGLGHPKIYLHITANEITCPYCSRKFVLEGNGNTDAH
jgi:uncharacterized Zn-finger protein